MTIDGQPDDVVLHRCETCFALVIDTDRRAHEYWHEDLMDWVNARCD